MIDETIINALKKLKIENIKKEHISKIGEGSWHTVYRIERQGEEDLALRVKKKTAYGHLQEYQESELITEYESTKIYYHYANACNDNLCPSYFDYYLDPSLVFTIESFMGKGTIQSLNQTEAFFTGEKAGYFFQEMHNQTPDIKGFGKLKWNGEKLEGSIQEEFERIWQDDNNFYISILDKLISSHLKFDVERITAKIDSIIEKRRNNPQKIALVNQDITPENIIMNTDYTAIIDPLPRLDFDVKYAGYFVFCYKFLLPAYSNAPRYRHNSYSQHAAKLSEIADGFIKGYTNHDVNQIEQIMNEYTLWVLLEAYEHLEVLNEENVSYQTLQQMGNKEMIKNRLILCLKQLESLCLDLE
ncbi:hypothetical protein [Oceanobacillus neutriphilus]|uniref:Aminoglycoside phosphotransferase domain-containing protein n=1 Tax=Oceanobacillus neutriphilus TaxID=531815 RepID=A0ABQ2NUL0_9BACI|nr:hypothetical protein [Oceanobacillus neutriphilus]GGP10925.1 hypothetical protein GCM10011346_20980 [Oceanobacillus neutriphilus]